MKILVAEYASAIGMGGTCEIEGRAMLSALVGSFERCGHEVIYPTSGRRIGAGKPILLHNPVEFETVLESSEVDAGLLIAPDDLQSNFLEVLERNTVNLGCSPIIASLCADKLICTKHLKRNDIPVAEIVNLQEPCDQGCHQFVIKPRVGCGSQDVRIASNAIVPDGYIATRYVKGMHLSTSFIVGQTRFLPITINRQLIEFHGDSISYCGSQVPYNTSRADEIWNVAIKASGVLGIHGYAGIDFVLGDLPRVVDVNARPTTSIIGIIKVIKEEIGELILRASFGELPIQVGIQGEHTFRKNELNL